jgi:hypothetical protein
MYENILVNLYTKTIGGRKRGGIWFPKLYSPAQQIEAEGINFLKAKNNLAPGK